MSASVLKHLSGNSVGKVGSTTLSTGSDVFINFLSYGNMGRVGFRMQYYAYGKESVAFLNKIRKRENTMYAA